MESFEIVELLKKKIKLKTLSTFKTSSEMIKIFSDNLFQRLIVEECKGDFCNYEFLEKIKGVLRLKNNEYPGQKDLNHNHKLLGSIFAVSKLFFHYNLSFLRVNYHLAFVKKFYLKQEKIGKKILNY